MPYRFRLVIAVYGLLSDARRLTHKGKQGISRGKLSDPPSLYVPDSYVAIGVGLQSVNY